MKKIKYLIAILITLTTTYGCVKDEILNVENGIEGSVVVLNEIMSNNVGDGIDWIEIYNKGAESIELGGYMLNDAKDPSGGWAIPDGTVIEAGGYIVFDEDTWTFGGVSSGGEWVSFADADGNLIDNVEVPSMAAYAGLTYAREIDGGEIWIITSPTEGAMNGDVDNLAPILDASDLSELDRIYSVTASDANGISSVKLVYMVNDGVVSLDMSLVDGKFRTSVPLARVGDIVKYFVIATDNTGLKTVYPEGGMDTPGEYTVIGGFEEVAFSEVETVVGIYDFSFRANVYYADQVDEVRAYYLLPGESQDDVTGAFDDKHKIVATDLGNGAYVATITDIAKTTELRYYMRVEYIDGTKTYYPMETFDIDGNLTSDFNHDLGTTWPTVTVGEIPVAPVNGFSELSITNEAATDLVFNFKVEYDNGDVSSLKFYYVINYDAATMWWDDDTDPLTPDVFDDASYRIDLEETILPSADNMYTFTIPSIDLTPGDQISWYMRAKDGAGDKMYYTFGKTADEFDGDTKDDPATWHVVTKL